jgi:hypothetical protein
MIQDTQRVVWFSLGIAYIIFVFATVALYIRKFHYKKEALLQFKFTSWSKHSSFLAVTCSICGSLLIAEGMAYTAFEDFNYPCLLPAYYRLIFWTLWLNTFTGRLIRLTCQYRANELKLQKNSDFISSPPSKKSLVKKSLRWSSEMSSLERYEYFSQESLLFKYSTAITLFFVLLQTIIGVLLNFDESRGFNGCILSVGSTLSHLVIGIYGFVLLPIAFYFMRKTKDVYGMGRALALCTVFGLNIYIAYFIYVTVASPYMLKVYPARNLGYAFLAFTHVVTICVPLICRKKESKLGLSENGFYETMSDVTLLDSLKNITIQEFNSENMLFWLSYYNLIKLCYLDIIKQGEGLNENSMFETRLFKYMNLNSEKLKAELLKDYSKPLAMVLLKNGHPESFHSEITTCLEAFYVPDFIWQEFLKIGTTFLDRESCMELNVQESLVKDVIKTLKYLKEYRYNQRIKLCFSSSEKVKADLTKDTNCEYLISVQLFDQIKNEILRFLFLNSFPHIVEKNQL